MNVGKKILEKQGYRFTGEHSSIKICDWTKKAIRGEGVCYKQKFYGINTIQCVQMTPTMICPNRYLFGQIMVGVICTHCIVFIP